MLTVGTGYPTRRSPCALVPNLAAWVKVHIDGALAAAGTNAAKVGFDKLAQTGVLYEGIEVLAGGAIVVGLLWGAMAAFMIDRRHNAAAVVALTAAVLTLFGFIHGPAVDWFVSPKVALAYLFVAVLMWGFARMESEPGQDG